jgi:hypothetical protein
VRLRFLEVGWIPRRYVLKASAGSERTSGDDAEVRRREEARGLLVGLRVQGQLPRSFGGVKVLDGDVWL